MKLLYENDQRTSILHIGSRKTIIVDIQRSEHSYAEYKLQISGYPEYPVVCHNSRYEALLHCIAWMKENTREAVYMPYESVTIADADKASIPMILSRLSGEDVNNYNGNTTTTVLLKTINIGPVYGHSFSLEVTLKIDRILEKDSTFAFYPRLIIHGQSTSTITLPIAKSRLEALFSAIEYLESTEDKPDKGIDKDYCGHVYDTFLNDPIQ